MITAAGLLVYAVLLVTAGAPALARARWPERAPRLAISLWLALAGSAVTSVAVGGLVLAVPGVRLSPSLGRLAEACLMALRARYAHPAGAALACAGMILAFAVLARVSWSVIRTLTGAARRRHRHRRGLTLIGRLDRDLGAVVVDHREPAAWCLPGPGRPVVLTTAAIEALDRAQLAAVLAHERAHQRGRHHLLVALAGSLAAAFPRVPAFRLAHEQVARLVELLADDAAAAASRRLTVAGALLAMGAPAPAPVAALGAGGPGTAARVRRLIARPARLGAAAAAAAVLTVAALISVPLAALAGPAVVSGGNPCPPPAAAVHRVS